MADEEMVQVRIVASQKLRFDQIKNIPKKEWDEYRALVAANARDSEFQKFGELYIEPNDPVDWDDYDDVEIDLCDDEGRPLPDPHS